MPWCQHRRDRCSPQRVRRNLLAAGFLPALFIARLYRVGVGQPAGPRRIPGPIRYRQRSPRVVGRIPGLSRARLCADGSKPRWPHRRARMATPRPACIDAGAAPSPPGRRLSSPGYRWRRVSRSHRTHRATTLSGKKPGARSTRRPKGIEWWPRPASVPAGNRPGCSVLRDVHSRSGATRHPDVLHEVLDVLRWRRGNTRYRPGEYKVDQHAHRANALG